MNSFDAILWTLFSFGFLGAFAFLIVEFARYYKKASLREKIQKLNYESKCNICWEDNCDVEVYMPQEFYGNNPGFSHFTFERSDDSLTHVKQAIKFVEDYQKEV